MKANIPHNGNKGVANYIIGSCVLVAMNKVTTTHRVNGMCAHALKDTYNRRMGQSKLYLSVVKKN
jgi:hypothetical protein